MASRNLPRKSKQTPTENNRALSATNIYDDALFGRLPREAIKTRPGKGGQIFRYVPHGYVQNELNRVFKYGWDFRLLPVFNGNIQDVTVTQEQSGFDVVTRKPIMKDVRNIEVYGELTVKLWDSESKSFILTVRGGIGSQNWERTMEKGDAAKGAAHDSLKVCAHSLGNKFGLELYWDDRASVDGDFEEVGDPTTITQLIAAAKSDFNLGVPQIEIIMHIADLTEVPDEQASELWEQLCEYMSKEK